MAAEIVLDKRRDATGRSFPSARLVDISWVWSLNIGDPPCAAVYGSASGQALSKPFRLGIATRGSVRASAVKVSSTMPFRNRR